MTFRFLVSFHYHAATDLQAIADAYGGPVEVFADSGAYSAATLGVTIKLADYAAWLRDWRHLITTAATLDVIGDHEATHHNTRALEDRGLRVLPAFHIGTPWPVLEQLCAEYRYVALGGMVPHTNQPDDVMRWLIRAFKTAQPHGTVFHGFGQTRFTTLAALPFYSVDSSAWGSGARYGRMALWDERLHRLVTVQTGDPAAARTHAALLRSHGVDPTLVGRPGFAILKQRTPEQYNLENRMMRGAPAVAFHRLGEWLIRRHHVPPPPGWENAGTTLYLADATHTHLNTAAHALTQEARGTRLFLADGSRWQLLKTAEAIAAPGTRLFLADTAQANLRQASQAIATQTRKDTTP